MMLCEQLVIELRKERMTANPLKTQGGPLLSGFSHRKKRHPSTILWYASKAAEVQAKPLRKQRNGPIPGVQEQLIFEVGTRPLSSIFRLA
jgi:hypothetical protein